MDNNGTHRMELVPSNPEVRDEEEIDDDAMDDETHDAGSSPAKKAASNTQILKPKDDTTRPQNGPNGNLKRRVSFHNKRTIQQFDADNFALPNAPQEEPMQLTNSHNSDGIRSTDVNMTMSTTFVAGAPSSTSMIMGGAGNTTMTMTFLTAGHLHPFQAISTPVRDTNDKDDITPKRAKLKQNVHYACEENTTMALFNKLTMKPIANQNHEGDKETHVPPGQSSILLPIKSAGGQNCTQMLFSKLEHQQMSKEAKNISAQIEGGDDMTGTIFAKLANNEPNSGPAIHPKLCKLDATSPQVDVTSAFFAHFQQPTIKCSSMPIHPLKEARDVDAVAIEPMDLTTDVFAGLVPTNTLTDLSVKKSEQIGRSTTSPPPSELKTSYRDDAEFNAISPIKLVGVQVTPKSNKKPTTPNDTISSIGKNFGITPRRQSERLAAAMSASKKTSYSSPKPSASTPTPKKKATPLRQSASGTPDHQSKVQSATPKQKALTPKKVAAKFSDNNDSFNLTTSPASLFDQTNQTLEQGSPDFTFNRLTTIKEGSGPDITFASVISDTAAESNTPASENTRLIEKQSEEPKLQYEELLQPENMEFEDDKKIDMTEDLSRWSVAFHGDSPTVLSPQVTEKMKQLLGLIESSKKERSRSSFGSGSFRSGVEGLTAEIATAAEPAKVIQGTVPIAEPASPHADSLLLLDNISQPKDLLQLSEHTKTYPLPKLDVVTTDGGEEEQNTYVIASQTVEGTQEPNASTAAQGCKLQTKERTPILASRTSKADTASNRQQPSPLAMSEMTYVLHTQQRSYTIPSACKSASSIFLPTTPAAGPNPAIFGESVMFSPLGFATANRSKFALCDTLNTKPIGPMALNEPTEEISLAADKTCGKSLLNGTTALYRRFAEEDRQASSESEKLLQEIELVMKISEKKRQFYEARMEILKRRAAFQDKENQMSEEMQLSFMDLLKRRPKLEH